MFKIYVGITEVHYDWESKLNIWDNFDGGSLSQIEEVFWRKDDAATWVSQDAVLSNWKDYFKSEEERDEDYHSVRRSIRVIELESQEVFDLLSAIVEHIDNLNDRGLLDILDGERS
jgi:hypothetical protein